MHSRKGGERVGVVDQRVGRVASATRLGKDLRTVHVAPPGQHLGPYRPPGDGRLQVVAGEVLALRRVAVGFVDSALRQNRSRQQGGRLAGVGADAEGVQPFQCGPEVGLGGDRVALHRLDDSGEQLGLHQPVAQAEVRDRPGGLGQHRPGLVGRPAQRFEHGLAAHDVASTAVRPVVMRSTRTTSRQRPPARGTGLGPHSAACGRRAERRR